MAKGIKRKVVLPGLKLLFSLVLLLLVSCDGTVYHRFAQIDGSGWAANDTLTFVYEGGERISSGSEMELVVQVRYGAEYEYKDLCVRVESLGTDTALLSVDTLCCRMYDDRGSRLGSTAGTMYQNESNTVSIPALCTDTVILKVSHLMGNNRLQNVYDVGVRLVRGGE
ncbi:MAG: hypothetical protein J6Q73_04445 [Bacteroidaceae bacterium]|nr:hypothetical protein [Bacteroidaceae bacterium]